MSFNQSQLQPASFKGVRFEVDASKFKGGRRKQVHEYPQRDKPYVEDLGRATRNFSLEAWVCGNDCLSQRDALIAKLEEAGAGTLIHPWYGSLEVEAMNFEASEQWVEGRVVRFSIEFVEAGTHEFPSASIDTGLALAGFADQLQSFADGRLLSSFSTGLSSFIDRLGVGPFARQLNVFVRALSGFAGGANPFSSLIDDIQSIVETPQRLIDSVGSAFGQVIGVFTGLTSKQPKSSANTATTFDQASYQKTFNLPAGLVEAHENFVGTTIDGIKSPTKRAQLQGQAQALDDYVRLTLLAQACGSISALPAVVYDDVRALKGRLLQSLDVERYRADDELYVVLQDLRTALRADIAIKLTDAARIVIRDNSDPTPALVLAYEWHEASARDAEVIARNKIKHPLFVPVQPIKYLSQ